MNMHVYMTKEDYENWCKGWEVTVNNLPTVVTSPTGITQKLGVWVKDKDIINIQNDYYVNDEGVRITHAVVTVKQEKGPTASFL